MSILRKDMFRRWYVKVPLAVGILLWLILAFHLNSTVSAEGIGYFVAKNHPGGCSDSYPGTIDQPWCTIAKANAELNPGDTVYIREGIYAEGIKPAQSGIEGKYITYTNYQDEEVIITHVWAGADLDNRSYIHIDGINIEGVQILDDCCAEENIGRSCYDVTYWVRMENASYIILSNNQMKYASAWSGIRMTGGSHHNKILNNRIIGGYKPSDLIYCTGICSDNLIEGNEIYYGAHQSICLNCTGSTETGTDRNVVRNNWIYNPWHTGIGVEANSDYTIVENNIILDCGEDYTNNCRGGASKTKGRLYHGGIQMASSYVIVRNNVVVNAGGGITTGSGTYYDIYKYSRDIRVYNNTLYENYRGFEANSPPPSWVVGNTFVNNILAGSRNYDVWSYIRSDPGEPNPERFFFGNIFSSDTPLCYGDNDGLSCFDTLQEIEDALPSVFWDNTDLAPLFVDVSGRDFHLQAESPAIDAGLFLTKTIHAGSGTQVQVEDVRYFTDGFGIIEGDQIQLESQTQTARITNVDYDNNILTLDTSLTWAAGQGVSLPYSGNAPDIGAYEFSGIPNQTFTDVPLDHWAHDYIEKLYQEGYIAGCNLDPLMYCPNAAMNRAESAVFVERGIHGADYLPDQPTEQIFADVPLTEWFAKWATALWEDGYTAGCGTDPLIYCPLQGHTRAEGSVFFLRMMHGSEYVPPEPTGIFADVPTTTWYADWAEAAFNAGIIPACQTEPELLFCPEDPLDRAMAAYMMVQAKDLTIP
jgi:hypothetical protein